MHKLFIGLAITVCGLGTTGTAQADDFWRGQRRDRGHYHYHPGHFERHRDHYHYVPGHYDYHRGSHYRHLDTPRYGGYDIYRGNQSYGKGYDGGYNRYRR